jgi:hypothetical protein
MPVALRNDAFGLAVIAFGAMQEFVRCAFRHGAMPHVVISYRPMRGAGDEMGHHLMLLVSFAKIRQA